MRNCVHGSSVSDKEATSGSAAVGSFEENEENKEEADGPLYDSSDSQSNDGEPVIRLKEEDFPLFPTVDGRIPAAAKGFDTSRPHPDKSDEGRAHSSAQQYKSGDLAHSNSRKSAGEKEWVPVDNKGRKCASALKGSAHPSVQEYNTESSAPLNNNKFALIDEDKYSDDLLDNERNEGLEERAQQLNITLDSGPLKIIDSLDLCTTTIVDCDPLPRDVGKNKVMDSGKQSRKDSLRDKTKAKSKRDELIENIDSVTTPRKALSQEVVEAVSNSLSSTKAIVVPPLKKKVKWAKRSLSVPPQPDEQVNAANEKIRKECSQEEYPLMLESVISQDPKTSVPIDPGDATTKTKLTIRRKRGKSVPPPMDAEGLDVLPPVAPLEDHVGLPVDRIGASSGKPALRQGRETVISLVCADEWRKDATPTDF